MEFFQDLILHISTHEYPVLIYGVFLWHVVRWNKAKNKFDKTHKSFNSRRWWREEFDDIFRSLAFAGGIIILDDEFLNIFNSVFSTDYSELTKELYFISGLGMDRIISAIWGNENNGG